MSDPEKTEPATVTAPSKYRIRWTDVFCLILFLALFGGFLAITIIDLRDYSTTKCYQEDFSNPVLSYVSPSMLVVLTVSIICSILLTAGYYTVALLVYQNFVLISMVIQIIVCVACSIVYLVQRRWLSGAISMLWVFLSGIFYGVLAPSHYKVALTLEVVSYFLRTNFMVIVISVLGSIYAGAWSVLVAAVTLAGLSKTMTSDCTTGEINRPEGQFLGLLVYILLTHYIVTEIVKGLVRVATCCTFGHWYFGTTQPPPPDEMESYAGSDFEGGSGESGLRHEFIPQPGLVMESLLIGFTSSSGSICLSSMWLALSKLTAQITGAWAQELIVNPSTEDGTATTQDISVILLAWSLSNIVWCLDSFISHLTSYVIVFVSVYNDSCMKGLKKTWKLLTSDFGGALVNDFFANGSLMFGCWCIASLCALFVYIYLRWIASYPQEGVFFVTSFVFVSCLQVSSTFVTGIASAFQTFYVTYSGEPYFLEETHPKVYARLQNEHTNTEKKP